MEIKKFNESYQGNKIIKKYNNSILYKYEEDKKEYYERLKNEKNEILDLINEFIILNKDNFSSKYTLYPRIKEFNFVINSNNKPELFLSEGKYSFKVNLVYKDMNNLLNFLENPDLYRNTKKYNL